MDDRRIEQALHDAAPAVDEARVLDRVATKRAHRRTVKRLEIAAVAAVVVVGVVGLTAVVRNRGGESTPSIAAPAAMDGARIVEGDGPVSGDAGRVVTPQPLNLDTDEGYLRGPLFVGPTALSVAAYDRAGNGSYSFPPSRIVRVDGSKVVDRVDLKAEVLSITEGEGARWAVTRNPSPGDGSPPQSFLKRVAADGTVRSAPLPDGSVPNGPVAAVGGAVWVPLRDGVAQFDATDGTFVRHLDLPVAPTRTVAFVAKGAYATDRGTIRRLDPGTPLTDAIDLGPDVLGLAAADFEGRALLRNEAGGDDHARLARVLAADPVQLVTALPTGFHAESLAASATRVWATGTVDGAPAIVLLGISRVRATVILPTAAPDTTLVWSGPNTVTAATEGGLVRIAVP